MSGALLVGIHGLMHGMQRHSDGDVDKPLCVLRGNGEHGCRGNDATVVAGEPRCILPVEDFRCFSFDLPAGA